MPRLINNIYNRPIRYALLSFFFTSLKGTPLLETAFKVIVGFLGLLIAVIICISLDGD
jgi:hypothetical protein